MISVNKTQEDLLDACADGTWDFNQSKGVVDFNMSNKGLHNFKGIKFGIIHGKFDCSINNIKSLLGCPYKVDKDFKCTPNHLTSLVGGPSLVLGDYLCYSNNLITLKGVAKTIGRMFDCSDNDNLKNLEYFPDEIGGDFIFSRGTNLKGIKIDGIQGDLRCYNRFTGEEKYFYELIKLGNVFFKGGINPKDHMKVMIRQLYR